MHAPRTRLDRHGSKALHGLRDPWKDPCCAPLSARTEGLVARHSSLSDPTEWVKCNVQQDLWQRFIPGLAKVSVPTESYHGAHQVVLETGIEE